MKHKNSNRFLAVVLISMVTLSSSVFAVDRIKQNNATALNVAGSWDTLPGSGDVAVWNSTVLGANSTALGANLDWAGIKIVNPGGLVTIGTAATNTLTLGTSGIDMSSATQNLLVNSNLSAGGAQTWQVASGRTLQIQTINTNTRLTGSGNLNLVNSTGSGTAIFDFRPGSSGSTGFTDQNGFFGYSGNWTINSGVFVKTLRNGKNAWGSGTITLNGGTIAQQQNFSGTWTNDIILQTASNSTIDDSNNSGTRALKLQGVISSDGNLTIAETGPASYAVNGGVILTNTNTLSGQVTIAANGVLRVGGIPGTTNAAFDAGTGGTLGTATVVNNGTLTLSHSDTWTFANTITSGSGAVTIGGVPGTLVAGGGTQVVTMSGTNAYTGTTTVGQGRLNLTGSLASDINVTGTSRISGSGSTTGLLTTAAGTGIVLAGDATTTGLTVNGATFNGATTVTFDAAPIPSTVYDVFTYGLGTVTNPINLTVAWRGTLSDDVANKKYVFTAGASGTRTWNTTTGFLEQGVDENFTEGDNLFYGGDALVFNNPASDSTVTLIGALLPSSVTVNNTNAYTFDGAGYLSGTMSLVKSGTGTLTLNTANNFTGNVAINGGTIKLGNPTALGTSQVGKPVTQIVIGSGGALDLNGFASIYGFTISGTGVAGTGAITNTGGAIGNGFAQVSNLKLDADASIGGSGNWALLTNGYGATSLDLNAFTLTKTGTNTIALVNTTTTAGAVQVAEGTLALGVAENANGVNGSASAFTLDNTPGTGLSVVRNSSVGSLSGGGVTGGNIVLGETLTVGALNAPTSFAGVISGAGSLNKTGTSSLTLGNANTYTGTTTVSSGTLAVTTNTALGRGLSNAFGETSAVVDFGANTVTLGNATAGNTGSFFYGQLAGTGTLQLRGGTQTIHNADGTGSTSSNFQILLPVTAAMPPSAFALDTGASPTDRKDFGFVNDTNDVLTLTSLTGYGAIRTDAGGAATRHITVNQSSGDTVFNGALLSHRSGGNAVRALTFEKTGSSALELAGFVGKETASASTGAAPVNLIANGGVLSVTNAANTTTVNTDAINLGTITVTSGTLAFSDQALINNAGSAGASSILMNGGTLKWNAANTQDITAGNRLTLVDGKIATFDTSGNDVTLSNALGGGAIAAAVTKQGAGKLSLSGANTYTGDTVVNGGVLAVNGSSIADTNKLVIDGGKVEPTGTETVNTLFFGGVQQASGTWGSTSSTALHKDDSRFAGTGMVDVITPPASGYASWISGFSLGGQTGIDEDPDNDGIDNGLEFVLAGGNPEIAGGTQIPTGTKSGSNLIFSFQRDDRAKTAGITVTVVAGPDLVNWPSVHSVGTDTAGSSGTVLISNDGDAGPDTVTVTIPTSGAAEFFARLKVVGTP